MWLLEQTEDETRFSVAWINSRSPPAPRSSLSWALCRSFLSFLSKFPRSFNLSLLCFSSPLPPLSSSFCLGLSQCPYLSYFSTPLSVSSLCLSLSLSLSLSPSPYLSLCVSVSLFLSISPISSLALNSLSSFSLPPPSPLFFSPPCSLSSPPPPPPPSLSQWWTRRRAAFHGVRLSACGFPRRGPCVSAGW